MIGLIPYIAFTALLPSLHDYHLFNPRLSPSMNPNAATTGRSAASSVLEFAVNYYAVLLYEQLVLPHLLM